MSCKVCSSAKEVEFTAETLIHFRGLRHLENPGVLIFPQILICLDCGSARFAVPETELRTLRVETTKTAKGRKEGVGPPELVKKSRFSSVNLQWIDSSWRLDTVCLHEPL
jgi:hypothetical protein